MHPTSSEERGERIARARAVARSWVRSAVVCALVAACSDATHEPVAQPEPAPTRKTLVAPPSDRAAPARPVAQAPDLRPQADDVVRFPVLPARAHTVPVLVFHAICKGECPRDDGYSLPVSTFARMMTMVGLAGYRTITMDQYRRFLIGDEIGLPERPLLLTFDDGRYDSWSFADSILAALDMKATMFVITDMPETGTDDAYMRWSEVYEAAGSGRWDIQLHANAGHVKLPIGMQNGALVLDAAYASYRFDPMAPLGRRIETHEAWQERVETDFAQGEALLAANVPSYRSVAFAVPFDAYGQTSSDHRIETSMRKYLDSFYDVWFVQPSSDPDFTTPRWSTSHMAKRLVVGGTMTPERLYAWFATHASGPVPMRDAVAR